MSKAARFLRDWIRSRVDIYVLAESTLSKLQLALVIHGRFLLKQEETNSQRHHSQIKGI